MKAYNIYNINKTGLLQAHDIDQYGKILQLPDSFSFKEDIMVWQVLDENNYYIIFVKKSNAKKLIDYFHLDLISFNIAKNLNNYTLLLPYYINVKRVNATNMVINTPLTVSTFDKNPSGNSIEFLLRDRSGNMVEII